MTGGCTAVLTLISLSDSRNRKEREWHRAAAQWNTLMREVRHNVETSKAFEFGNTKHKDVLSVFIGFFVKFSVRNTFKNLKYDKITINIVTFSQKYHDRRLPKTRSCVRRSI